MKIQLSLRIVAAVLWSFGPFVACGENTGQIKLPPKDRFHLFLLVGQSNMAGRGKVEALDRHLRPVHVGLEVVQEGRHRRAG